MGAPLVGQVLLERLDLKIAFHFDKLKLSQTFRASTKTPRIFWFIQSSDNNMYPPLTLFSIPVLLPALLASALYVLRYPLSIQITNAYEPDHTQDPT